MRSHWGIIRCIGKSKHMRVSRFNTLWGFWRDLIHNFAAVSPFDRKKIIIGAARFATAIILTLFFYFLRRLLGFPHIFDPSVTQHPFFKSTLLLIICYTAVCKIVTERSSSVSWRHQKRLCSRLFSLRMCQKTISMWVAFTTQKARPRVDWLINCIYAAIKMETIYNRNSQDFRNYRW